MSMRLKAKMLDTLSSHVEESYMRQQDVMVLHNVQAEMVFQTEQGFMEHESQKHEYLPCFHLIGSIQEIRADFPYNVSGLYFGESDAQKLIKELVYYPTPDELAHLIKTGQYYTKNFTLPPILTANTYTLPCVVDLMIVPPPNPALYEQNAMTPFDNLEDEDKTNLPIFYIGVRGTGVNKKTDRTLAYYDIDLEPDYQTFIITAESSGYVDPPLLGYVGQPSTEVQQEQEEVAVQYITPEEESQLLQTTNERQQQEQQRALDAVAVSVQEDFKQPTEEDAIVAQAARAINRRMEATFGSDRLSLSAKREMDKKRQQMEQGMMADESSEVHAEPEQPSEQQNDKLTQPDVPQQKFDVKMDLNPESNTYVDTERKENAEKKSDEIIVDNDHREVAKFEGADVSDARAQAKVDEAHAKAVALDAALQDRQEDSAKDTAVQEVQAAVAEGRTDAMKAVKQPLDPQQMAEVKMDLNPEANAYVNEKRDDEKHQVPDVPVDRTDAEHMAGADVADARAQAKVDEAHARDLARDVAVDMQQQSADSNKKRRDVSSSMRDVTEKYDSSRTKLLQDDNEFI